MKNLRIENIAMFDLVDYTIFRDFTKQELDNQPKLTSAEINQGQMVATFQDEDLAKDYIDFYNRNKDLEGRPIVIHSFSSGEWKVDKKASLRVTSGSKTIANCSQSQSGDNIEEEQANSRAIAQVPNLVEIAEMYHDSLKSSGNDHKLVYQLIQNTLNKL